MPAEHSSGGTVRRAGITKTGNNEVRRILDQCAWCYRFPARMARHKERTYIAADKEVRDVAWRAQVRLCTRYRQLITRGKKRPWLAWPSRANLPASSGRWDRWSHSLADSRSCFPTFWHAQRRAGPVWVALERAMGRSVLTGARA